MKRAAAIFGIVFCTLYLLNFTMGIFEVPDNLPIIGNLDEVAVSLWLIASLKHFGLDLTDFLLPKKGNKKTSKHSES